MTDRVEYYIPEKDELAYPLEDLYGVCDMYPKPGCQCLKTHVWYGRGCFHFKSHNIKNHKELKEFFDKAGLA